MKVEKTIYISDMTKPIKSRNLEIGRETKNSNEIVLSKTTATHLNPDYQKLLNQQLYGYYLKDDQIKRSLTHCCWNRERCNCF